MKNYVCRFLTLFALLMSAAIAQAISLDSVAMKSSFEACSNIKILNPQLTPLQQFEYMSYRKTHGYQRMPKMEFLKGISDPRSIESGIHLMRLVASKKIQNIETHAMYYSAVKSCLQKSSTAPENCGTLLNQFEKTIQVAVPQLRRELALAIAYSPGGNYSASPRAHINVGLRAIPGLANPAGGTPLSAAEYAVAEADFQKDREIVKKEVEEQLAKTKDALRAASVSQLASFDESHQRIGLLKAAYAAQLLNHQANYAKILLKNPHLSFFPAGSLVSDKRMTNQQVVHILDDILRAGQEEVRSVEMSLAENRLEFARINGEAVWRSYFKGEIELLQFVSSPVMNEVLKARPEDCALAERLLERADLKDLQNLALVNMVFGVGTGTGLMGLTIKGALGAGRAVGIGETVSVAKVINHASNISMSVIYPGGAVSLYRRYVHSQMNDLSLSQSQ